MNTINKILIVITISLSLFFGISYASQNSSTLQKKSLQPTQANKNAKLLFVLSAKHAHITKSTNGIGQYKLTLTGVNHRVISFTDRPMRVTSKVKTKRFIQAWTNGDFKTNPPNAVMQAIQVKNMHKVKSTNFAVELQNPKYDVSTNTLTFDVTSLKGEKSLLPRVAKSDYVALFVDAYGCTGLSCW